MGVRSGFESFGYRKRLAVPLAASSGRVRRSMPARDHVAAAVVAVALAGSLLVVPEVALSYDSGSVDGLTAGANVQPSWIDSPNSFWRAVVLGVGAG
jgi:hypothetical protein